MIFGTNISIAKQPKEPQVSLRGGDVVILSPFGHMLHQPWTRVIKRFYCRWPVLPFLSLRLPGVAGKRCGIYIGFKGVGWDDLYKAWFQDGPADGFLILTARIFTDG